MRHDWVRRLSLALAVALLAGHGVARASGDAPKVKGQRVFICGHSFHIPIVNPLQEVAVSAGIADHKLVGAQFIGGSSVIKNWNQPDDMDKVKKALRSGEVDVLTLAPTAALPDEGIDQFTALALEHNPRVRIFVQSSWASFDTPNRKERAAFKIGDRDNAKIADLRASHAPFFKKLEEQVQGLNDQLKEKHKRQVVYVVPIGAAVLTLREKVTEGKVPGIAKQSDLFRDVTGHGKAPISVLNTYCHYAAIYRQSPIGLPVPSLLKGQIQAKHQAGLNRLLQELAWEAVRNDPLGGVKK